MNEGSTKTGGIGFFGVLGIVFITLKLCGIIDWAWWIVLSPIWAPILIWFVLVLIIRNA